MELVSGIIVIAIIHSEANAAPLALIWLLMGFSMASRPSCLARLLENIPLGLDVCHQSTLHCSILTHWATSGIASNLFNYLLVAADFSISFHAALNSSIVNRVRSTKPVPFEIQIEDLFLSFVSMRLTPNWKGL